MIRLKMSKKKTHCPKKNFENLQKSEELLLKINLRIQNNVSNDNLYWFKSFAQFRSFIFISTLQIENIFITCILLKNIDDLLLQVLGFMIKISAVESCIYK